MIHLISLIWTLGGPLADAPACMNPEPGPQRTGTSTQRLKFSPQGHPPISDAEKEQNRIRLGITQEQQKQIDDLYNETRAKMDEVWKSMREKQKLLRETYQQYELDEVKAKSLRIDILRLHRKMGEVQLENERKIRTILNREQFEKLQQLMKEKFEQFRRRGPGGPPPGH